MIGAIAIPMPVPPVTLRALLGSSLFSASWPSVKIAFSTTSISHSFTPVLASSAIKRASTVPINTRPLATATPLLAGPQHITQSLRRSCL